MGVVSIDRAKQQILPKGRSKGFNRWYVVVRGTVNAGDTLLSSGATFGMVEQLFKQDYEVEYVAATFCHLLCFGTSTSACYLLPK